MKLLRTFTLAALSAALLTKPPHATPQDLADNTASVIASLHLQPLSQSTQIERQIDAIVASLLPKLPNPPVVWICHGCGSSSHPTAGIIIDPDQIDNILRRAQLDDVTPLLTFVVAHEAAHQRQYALYGRDLYTRPVAERQYLEAQADLLAGASLFQLLPELTDPSRAPSLNRTLQALYDLGGEERALTDHPSKSGRLIAARLGLQYGIVSANGTANPLAGLNVSNLRHDLDILPSDDDMSFTLRMARRITLYNRRAARDLIYVETLGRKPDIDFDTNPRHPVVDYNFRYENRGSKVLIVAMQIQCIAVRREDPENIFSTLRASSNTHNFRLNPGATFQVKGELNWYGTNDMMPRIVTPEDPLGLIEVEYGDASAGATVPSRTENPAPEQSLTLVTDGARNTLAYGLNNLVIESRNSLRNLPAGPGKVYRRGEITYPSASPLPGSVGAVVYIGTDPDEDPEVVSTFIETTDAPLARQTFDDLIELVRAALPKVVTLDGTRNWTESKDDKTSTLTFEHNPFRIEVRLNSRDRSIGGDRTITLTRVELAFSSKYVLERADPGVPTPFDAVVAKLIGQVEEKRIPPFDGNRNRLSRYTPPDPPEGFQSCKIETLDSQSSLVCRHEQKHGENGVFAHTLESAALNAGAMENRAETTKGKVFLELTGPRGSEINIFESKGEKGPAVVLSIAEWQQK